MREFSQTVFSSEWNTGGATLVEASAGTGKTYNIQNAYLRLVLEGLRVQQILVVTFTEAATRELRERLRAVLTLCRDFLTGRLADGAPAADARRIREALKLRDQQTADNLADREGILKAIQLALMDFDGAAISTIHGFCKRVLERYAFECGHDPDAKLMTEQSLVIRETCQDWWRNHAYGKKYDELPFKNIGELVQLVTDVTRHPDAIRKPEPTVTASEQQPLVQKWAIARDLADTARTRIRDRAALTYDAMLFNVREVLRDPVAGPPLQERLREEFRAALIDEFQDTDTVQHEIFTRIFAPDTGRPLLFVGDPKQAIYGFRGGDIFTYYEAKKNTPAASQFSLGTNYRSERNLVAAVNAFFKDLTPGATFKNEHIPYPGDLRAQDIPEKRALWDHGQRDPAPLKLRIYTLDKDASIAEDSPVSRRIDADVVAEIVRILRTPKVTIGQNSESRPLKPSDIAILVRTHSEAATFQSALIRGGVNAVRQSTGNVFDSDEARELALVMQAMLTPGRASALRSALFTRCIPCHPTDIRRFNDDGRAGEQTSPPPDDTMDTWMETFREAGARWKNRSFIEAFHFLLETMNLRAHVAAQPSGNRRLTDLLHLAQLTHRTALDRKLAPVALLRWYIRQLDTQRRDSDTEDSPAKVRLSNDEDAVQIMTVFKSKGLQFPIVFLPTLWRHKAEGKGVKESTFMYHEGNRLVLDLDVASSKPRAMEERLQENIRLVYVGLTRAINRVYLFAPQHSKIKIDTHAVAHLLDQWEKRTWESQVIDRQEISDLVDVPPQSTLPAHATQRPETLAVAGYPNVDKTHGHASFSSLASHRGDTLPPSTTSPPAALPEGVDVDQQENAPPPTPETDEPPAPIFAIPGGAKLGSCWHEIFEKIDFQSDPNTIAETVNATLNRYGVCMPTHAGHTEATARIQSQRDAIHTMVKNTLQARLDAGHGPFRLRDIPLAARRSELPFHFSLDQQRMRALGGMAEILRQHWNPPGRDDEFIARLDGEQTPLPGGFMTGAIDLVFEHGNRFHIVDFKSNQLTRRAEDFNIEGLKQEMRRNDYYLQALIYSVALHGFLSGRLKGYSFEKHIGGVFYLFLRGMDARSQRGIFVERPSRALIEALSAFLTGGAS